MPAAGAAALWRRALPGGCERSAIISIDANQDGLADPHPTLSAQAPRPTDPGFVPWLSPLVLMQRFAFDYVRNPDGSIDLSSGQMLI